MSELFKKRFRYGRWTVLSPSGKNLVKCKCDCGTVRQYILLSALESGLSTSCGCLRRSQLTDGTLEGSFTGQKRKRKSVDLSGEVFGKWTVIERNGTHELGQSLWKCRCSCGKVKDQVLYGALKSGNSQSCGCIHKMKSSDRFKTHGLTKSEHEMYVIWQGVKTRCLNSKHPSFKNHGARGIKICPEWQDSFPAFLKGVGIRPSKHHSLDRKNNDGNYEPGNVRWADRITQATNRSNAKPVLWNGEPIKLVDLCLEQDVNYNSVYNLIRKGIAPKDAILKIRKAGLKYVERSKTSRV